MAQLTSFHSHRVEWGVADRNQVIPARPELPPVIWLRWVCGAALVSLLVVLGIASWAAEGDAGCSPAVHAD